MCGYSPVYLPLSIKSRPYILRIARTIHKKIFKGSSNRVRTRLTKKVTPIRTEATRRMTPSSAIRGMRNAPTTTPIYH